MTISRRQFIAFSIAAAAATAGCEKMKKTSDAKENPFQFKELKIANSLIKMEFAVLQVLPYRQHLLEDAWDQIDQQMISFEQRQILEQNGMRVGVTGSSLPPNLSLLLEPPAIDRSVLTNLEKEMIQAGVTKPKDLMEKHVKISLKPNRTKDLSFGYQVPEMSWTWRNGQGTSSSTFKQVDTRLRVVGTQTAGRSIRLGIIPFIIHGKNSARYEAREDDFEMVLERKQHLVSEAGTKLPVSLGQTVVIGPSIERSASTEEKFGHCFFGEKGQLSLGNRIVMLRLLHAGNSDLFGERIRSNSLVNEI